MLVRSLLSGARWGLRVGLAPFVVTLLVGVTLLAGPWDASAAPVAKGEVRPHELVGLRDARSKTSVQADGSLVTTLSRQSLHWFDPQENGWRKIETDLAVSAKAGVGWESGENRFTVEVAERTPADTDALVSFEGRSGRMEFALAGVVAGKAGANEMSNAVLFRGVQPGVDVEYVVLPDGLKESIVLRERGAPSAYTFRLTPGKGEKWRAEQLEESGLWSFFVEGSAEPEFVLLPPTVGDSGGVSAAQAGADEVPQLVNTVAGKASLEVKDLEDGSFQATVSIDEDRTERRSWLHEWAGRSHRHVQPP